MSRPPRGVELLILQATPFCNLDCRYCYLPERSRTDRMSLETARKAAELVSKIGPAGSHYTVVWHVGEPMVLSPDWFRTAHQAISEVLGENRVRFQFQSNGTLLNEEWVQLLSSDRRLEICLSIDGPAWMHDANRRTRRGKGSHAQTMGGVARLKTASIPFDCIAVVTEITLDHPEPFFDFFEALHPRGLALNPEEKDGVNSTSSLGSDRTEARYRRFLRRFGDLWHRERPFIVRELNRLEQAHENRAPGLLSVNHQTEPWRIVTVGSRGELHTFSPELLGIDIPGVGASLGNVHRDDWNGITTSPQFQKLDRQIQEGVERCRSRCSYFHLCGGGAPSNKWSEHGTFTATETSFCRLSVQAAVDELWAER